MAYALWSGDVLRRDELASRLINIIRTHKSGTVIGVEGEFGSGKTYFLTNLRMQLEKDGLATVYFNAWEADYLQFPLLALMGDIVAELRKRAPQALGEKIADSAKRLFPVVARIAAKSILRAGDDDLDKLLGPMYEEIDHLIAAPEKASALGRQELIKARSALAEIVDAARSAAPSAFPLVVLVDELDRAHPEWIVTFLESIKHLLGHQHIIFLVAIDRRNLDVLLRHRFGDKYDVAGYLSKFFSYSLNIQSSVGDHEFLKQRLIDAKLVSDGIFDEGTDLCRSVAAAATGCIFGLGGPSGNLRRLERCADRIDFCARAMGGAGWSALIGFLVGLSITNPSLLAGYGRGITGRSIVDALKQLRVSPSDHWLLVWLTACAIRQSKWSAARTAVRMGLGEDMIAEVEELVRQETFTRVSGETSIAETTLEQIGWLLR